MLLASLRDPQVSAIVSSRRSPGGRTDPRLREIIHADFIDYGGLRAEFAASTAVRGMEGRAAIGDASDTTIVVGSSDAGALYANLDTRAREVAGVWGQSCWCYSASGTVRFRRL